MTRPAAMLVFYTRRASFGSSRSRSPSPSTLTARIIRASAAPGNRMMRGAIGKKARPSAIMLPQLGISGGVPAPRKRQDRLGQHRGGANVGRLHDQRGMQFGSTWRMRMSGSRVPSRDRGLDVGLLAHRQHDGAHQPHHARDLRHRDRDDDGTMLAPESETSAIASRTPGIAISPSMMRITIASSTRT